MTLKEFQNCIEFNIEHDIKHAVLGLGAPGVGKSQVIKQIGERYGYKVIDLRLAQMSEVEIGGLIYPNENHTKTRWLSPEILPDEERDGKHTILLLDEITSCSKRVQVAAYQLILDRRVGQYTLPEGTFVIALGNREDDDGVYIQLAGPLADRFEIHYIDVDFNGWKNDFAIKKGIHQSVIDYLTFKPTALHNQGTTDDSMVFATPRSWERVSDILKFDDDITKPVICNKIIGNVGVSEGKQFIEFCRKHKKFVSVVDFIQGNVKAPNDPSEVSILINAMTREAEFIRQYVSYNMLSELEKVNLNLIITAAFKFDSSEFTIMALRNLLSVNRTVVKDAFYLMDNAEIARFLTENKSLLGL